MTESQSTVASLLPPKVRAWTYALLVPANAGLVAAMAATDSPRVYGIALAVVNALGFTMAAQNTTTTPKEN